jgi:hypothetical protein
MIAQHSLTFLADFVMASLRFILASRVKVDDAPRQVRAMQGVAAWSAQY